MANENPQEVTLRTVHEGLTAGFADVKGAIADVKGAIGDLKTTLIAGFSGLPTRESSEEMVRLLRQSNRLQEERFTQLDLRIREQHLETQQTLHAVLEGQRLLVDGQRLLAEGQRALIDGQRVLIDEVRNLAGEVRVLSADLKALIARIDALIRGRGDGGPAS